ncbi:hypothetical protein [Nostoc sp. ChiSLP03a]|nr:hypothetical protein [Nostoc sp. ChiSLP03a]MDZ8211587.1 hypothetical protein [Nostoc sp. ChiSLP03a]
MFSATLWFVKNSDRLKNPHSAIALFFLYVLCAWWNGSLKKA